MIKSLEDIFQYLQSAKSLLNHHEDEKFIEYMQNISAINEYVNGHICDKGSILKIFHEINHLIKELEVKNEILANKINQIRKHQNANQSYQNHF